jgi:WD40 repeat protein
VVDFKQHQGTVRAISWAPPGRNRIVTGGGTTDQHIKIWDPDDGTTFMDAHTGCQLCNLHWNTELGEIVSTEGFRECTMTFWNETDLKVIANISGHRDRVLYCSVAPNERNAVTLTPKDGLQFWNLSTTFDRSVHSGDVR